MTADVEPRFKTNRGECECGCGLDGVYRARGWRDGTRCVRTCVCKRCRGRQVRASGGRKQRTAAKALGIQNNSIRTGHEENAGGAVRFENKSGAQAGPVWTRFLASEAQSDAARAIGDPRPFVATYNIAGSSDTLVVFRLSNGDATCRGLLENWEGP